MIYKHSIIRKMIDFIMFRKFLYVKYKDNFENQNAWVDSINNFIKIKIYNDLYVYKGIFFKHKIKISRYSIFNQVEIERINKMRNS